jgi:hypothetical protein
MRLLLFPTSRQPHPSWVNIIAKIKHSGFTLKDLAGSTSYYSTLLQVHFPGVTDQYHPGNYRIRLLRFSIPRDQQENV